MMKKLFYLLILGGTTCFGQEVLDEYPRDQFFYEGGVEEFYKEVHQYLVEGDFKECSQDQIYIPRILVTKEGKVKLVTDSDKTNIANNKCAYDLSLAVLKGLKKWKPAEVKGNVMGAITEFPFYPYDLMSNYKEGYSPYYYITPPKFPGGREAFKKAFDGNFRALFQDYHIQGMFNLEYYVNLDGTLSNPRVYPTVWDKQFNIDFLRAFGRLKKKWEPALYKGKLPIKYRMVHSIDFSVKFIER